MAVQHHPYPVTVEWSGGRDAQGTATPKASGEVFPLRVPTEFNGPGGGTNPEELLTSAIAGCYSITVGIVLTNRKLPLVSVTTEAEGIVEQQGMNFTYKQITIKPTLKVTVEATDDQIAAVIDMAHKADAYCIVTNAVRGKVEVVVEPKVVRAE